ncbi:hypothetical protein [Bacillus sp. S10(2024)]|uniref:hypothetical protein n=1 Tax=Bacillus sp. S10(2024) TaxID=3162886 RepID=UPI003D25EE86
MHCSSRTWGPIYHELHQIFVELFDEMSATEKTSPNSSFSTDMLLDGIKQQFLFIQRDERGYLPEGIAEQLC